MQKIIIYSEVDWNFLDQRHHHLARFCSNSGMQVIFVSRVYSRIPNPKEIFLRLMTRFTKTKSTTTNIRKALTENIELRRSYFFPPTNRLLRSFNFFIWAFRDRKLQDNAIVYSFVNNPDILGPEKLRTYNFSIFDIIHNWWDFPWHTATHRNLVRSSLVNFDRIVTDSPAISKKLANDNIYHELVMPAATEEWLNICQDFSDVRPVFFGNLRENSDLNLIEKICVEFGLDLIGLVDPNISKRVTQINYLGQFLQPELIKKLTLYNIIILPYNNSRFSGTIAPAKYFEALATGALVISNGNLEHLPGFKKFILKVSPTDSDFRKKVVKAFFQHENIRDEQVNFAKLHQWNDRFSDLFCSFRNGSTSQGL